MAEDAILARDGDVLVVSYPEVKIPLATRFGTISIGGLIYTRKLLATDNVEAEYDRIYSFLRSMAERDARLKVKLWHDELVRRKEPAVEPPPKPATVGQAQPPTAAAGRPKPEVRR